MYKTLTAALHRRELSRGAMSCGGGNEVSVPWNTTQQEIAMTALCGGSWVNLQGTMPLEQSRSESLHSACIRSVCGDRVPAALHPGFIQCYWGHPGRWHRNRAAVTSSNHVRM